MIKHEEGSRDLTYLQAELNRYVKSCADKESPTNYFKSESLALQPRCLLLTFHTENPTLEDFTSATSDGKNARHN